MGRIELRNLDSWKEFREHIADIRAMYGYLKLDEDSREERTILFRGQANADDWDLTTTLERRVPGSMTLDEYMIHIIRCTPEIESLSDMAWHVPDYNAIRHELDDEAMKYRVSLPCYDYLVYMRHHGFPSPLLDWTESPYVAAYFAFCEKHSCERVAIYAYIGEFNLSTGGQIGDPMISLQWPYVRTDRRHFAQKAWYTVATTYNESTKIHTFCSHEAVFAGDRLNAEVLVKMTMPTRERGRALRELMIDYNIDHFTLFQTEDALVQSLAMKAFDLE